jgi:hypothetical protein
LKVPVKVAPDGDDVVLVWVPIGAPVIVARVDAATGADVWRFHLPAGDVVEADVVVDKSSLRLAIARYSETTEPTLIDVFDLDPDSAEGRWAVRIPLLEMYDIDAMQEANPFTKDTEAAVVSMDSTLRVSIGSDVYTLSASDGAVTGMLDAEATLASLFPQLGPRLVMRSITVGDGVVATAADTVALIL